MYVNKGTVVVHQFYRRLGVRGQSDIRDGEWNWQFTPVALHYSLTHQQCRSFSSKSTSWQLASTFKDCFSIFFTCFHLVWLWFFSVLCNFYWFLLGSDWVFYSTELFIYIQHDKIQWKLNYKEHFTLWKSSIAFHIWKKSVSSLQLFCPLRVEQ